VAQKILKSALRFKEKYDVLLWDSDRGFTRKRKTIFILIWYGMRF